MTTARPVDPTQRILSIDALRGIALFGILLINIPDMGGPIAMDRPITVPTIGDPDWQVWTISQLFITGTMRGLFSMLFGVGLMLFLRHEGEQGGAGRRRLYLRRLAWLFLFGVIDSTLLLWPGDILLIYAMAGLVLLPLRRREPTQLWGAALVILLLLSFWAAFEGSTLTYGDVTYSSAMIAREGAARLGGYGANLAYMMVVSWAWTVNAFTLRWIGDAAAFMLVGMAIHRSGLFHRDVSVKLLRRLAILAYAAGLALRTIHTVLILAHEGVPTNLSSFIDQPGRLAMTLGHLFLFLLLWRSSDFQRVMRPFASAGRMALTLYLGQSIAGALIFAGFGLALWNSLSWPQLWAIATLVFAAQLLFAHLWFSRFRYGPMEWLWRWGTYGRRPG